MKREILPNGNIKLSALNGVLHLRTGMVHSHVICKPKEEKWFVENPAD